MEETLQALQAEVATLKTELAALRSKTEGFCWVFVSSGIDGGRVSYSFTRPNQSITIQTDRWVALPEFWRETVLGNAAMEERNFGRVRIEVR